MGTANLRSSFNGPQDQGLIAGNSGLLPRSRYALLSLTAGADAFSCGRSWAWVASPSEQMNARRFNPVGSFWDTVHLK